MFRGSLHPISADVPLNRLLACAGPAGLLGAWVRPGIPKLTLYHLRDDTAGRVLVSSDLGLLLGKCDEVAVREDQQIRVLSAETVIHWRALQVATATPYLPGLERLQRLFPRVHVNVDGFLVSLSTRTPEEVLARCVAEGVRVAGSQIVYAVGTLNLPPGQLPP